MRVQIEVDTKTFVRFWLVMIGFIAAGFALYSAKTALIILFASAFLAICLSRFVDRLAKVLPGKSRLGGTAVAFGLVVVFLGMVVTTLVPPIIDQTVQAARSVPYLLDKNQNASPLFSDIVQQYHLEGYVDNAINSVQQSTDAFAYNVGSSIFSVMGSFARILVASVLTFFLTFLMLLEGPRWIRSLWNIYDDVPRRELHKSQLKRMHTVVTSFVTGQVVLAGLSALTTGLVIFLLHYGQFLVPLGFVLPAISVVFVLSLIPMFGPVVAGVFVTAVLAFGDVFAAGIFAVFFIFYQQMQRSVVAPVLQTKVVEITPLLVLSSVVVGFYMLGWVGAIIAVPIAGCVKVVVEDYLHHTQKMKSVRRFASRASLKTLLRSRSDG